MQITKQYLKDLEQRIKKLEKSEYINITTLHTKRFLTSLSFFILGVSIIFYALKQADFKNDNIFYVSGVVTTFVLGAIFLYFAVKSWCWYDNKTAD